MYSMLEYIELQTPDKIKWTPGHLYSRIGICDKQRNLALYLSIRPWTRIHACRSTGKAALILNLATRWSWVVSLTRPLARKDPIHIIVRLGGPQCPECRLPAPAGNWTPVVHLVDTGHRGLILLFLKTTKRLGCTINILLKTNRIIYQQTLGYKTEQSDRGRLRKWRTTHRKSRNGQLSLLLNSYYYYSIIQFNSFIYVLDSS
jgi:hypothetical protein